MFKKARNNKKRILRKCKRKVFHEMIENVKNDAKLFELNKKITNE